MPMTDSRFPFPSARMSRIVVRVVLLILLLAAGSSSIQCAEGIFTSKQGYDTTAPQEDNAGLLGKPTLLKLPEESPVWRAYVQEADLRDYLHFDMKPEGKGISHQYGLGSFNVCMAGYWSDARSFVAYYLPDPLYSNAGKESGKDPGIARYDIVRVVVKFEDNATTFSDRRYVADGCWLVLGEVVGTDAAKEALVQLNTLCKRLADKRGIVCGLGVSSHSEEIEKEYATYLPFPNLAANKVFALHAVEQTKDGAEEAVKVLKAQGVNCYIKKAF